MAFGIHIPGPWLRWLLIAAGLVLVYWILAFFLVRSILFIGADGFLGTNPAPPPGWSVARIETAEGPVTGWYLPAPSSPTRGPAAVLFHGNAETVAGLVPWAEAWHLRGFHVLLVEFRGYGGAAGSPSAAKLAEDARAFHSWLTNRPDVDPARLVFHARSLGCAVALQLAAERPPSAAILQSPFLSVAALVRRNLIPSFLVRDRFDNLEAVRRLESPLLIFHGRLDTTVPPSQGEALAAAAPRGEAVLLDCGHNDCPPDELAYWQKIDAFVAPTTPRSPR